MDVRLLYFPDCPSWRLAAARLHEALARIGDSITEVTYQLVRTPEEAERAGFRGSPTIMVNGHDPFARTDDPIGLACRLYPAVDGEQHAPTVDDLHSALADAR